MPQFWSMPLERGRKWFRTESLLPKGGPSTGESFQPDLPSQREASFGSQRPACSACNVFYFSSVKTKQGSSLLIGSTHQHLRCPSSKCCMKKKWIWSCVVCCVNYASPRHQQVLWHTSRRLTLTLNEGKRPSIRLGEQLATCEEHRAHLTADILPGNTCHSLSDWTTSCFSCPTVVTPI